MSYDGDDPDGFMAVPEVVAFIDSYAVAIKAPVLTGTAVTRVAPASNGYQVTTSQGIWDCETLVVASGTANVANLPSVAAAVPDSIEMVTPMTYRSPEVLDHRPVLVVGASASGVQLADEIHRSGRPVTISAGEQVRLPRTYRGCDVFWWLEATGVLDERHDDVDDIIRARHVPSPQLIGSPERLSIDLNSLGQLGVQIVGRLCSIRDGVAQFSGGFTNSCRLADLKMNRLLNRFDNWAHSEMAEVFDPPNRFEPIRTPSAPTLEVDLRRQGIGTIVWATGYHADYSWLDLPVLDYKGQIRHLGGIVGHAPGMYLLGGNLLRARRSSYISGAVNDTDELAAHLYRHLNSRVHPTGVRRAEHGALQFRTNNT
jgi:putative flavoprotein involved in K+ transport